MKTGAHNSLFRSASMRSSKSLLSGKVDQGVVPNKCASASLDNLPFEMSRNTLHEWFPGSGEFSRTEGVQCIIVPDKVLLTEVVRHQRSVTLNYGGCARCDHDTGNVSNSKLKRSSSVKEKTREIKCVPRSQTMQTLRSDDTSTSSMKPRQCMSLYERKFASHSCAHVDKRPKSPVKPSPWTYGSTSPKDNKKSTGKDVSFMRTRSNTTSSLSLDSSGSLTKRSLSSTSSSSESVQDNPKERPSIKRLSSANDSNEKQRIPIPTQKQSFIPRPVTPMQDQFSRDRSHTISEFSFGKKRHGPSPSVLSPTQNRSQSKKPGLLRMSGVVKSEPASAVHTPTDAKSTNGWTDDLTTKSRIRPSSSESLDLFTSQERLIVPDDEGSYPEPKPPGKNKVDIFRVKDYAVLDQYAKKVPGSTLDSFDELIEYLLKDQTVEVAKARALHSWLVSADIPLTSKLGSRNINTPKGFLYNIGQRRATYPELYATLCRKAGIPCVIIHGYSKGVAHDVGAKVTPKKHKNSWNAVYIEDDWHFVHPYWAGHSVNGYSTGRWSLVECDAFHTGDLDPKNSSTRKVTEFYFLTDPDKFITKCFPEDPNWQLLHHTISKSDFESLPLLQPTFHDLRLALLDISSCVLHTNNGKTEIKISLPSDRRKRYKFGYKLFARHEVDSEGEYDVIDLRNYIFHYMYDSVAVFEIRFPVTGVFKLELHCEDIKRPLPATWICDFKIICHDAMPECEAFPMVPKIGWGPGSVLEETGVESLTHKHPVVSLDEDTTTYIRFALPKDREVEIETEIFTNSQSAEELHNHVIIESNDDHVTLQVSPPGEGEYALQIFVKDERGTRKNVCNYLMHRTHIVEDPELSDIRAELLRATENGDADSLAYWLEKFNERDMEDRGDLSRARKTLQVAKLNRDIREAMDRKDLDLLERALHSVSDTSIRRHLGELAGQAEAMRSRLRRLKRLKHEVLAMDQKTISEIRSYPKPPVAVHTVMAATFLLLGNKEADMKKWSKIQALISKHGRESLKRRVADFKLGDVPAVILKRVNEILSRYDLETIQITSAGAATFYQWAITMAGEAEEETAI